MAIENITRFVQYRDTKANIQALNGTLEEAALSFATDTGQMGIYTNGNWIWITTGTSGGLGGGTSIAILDDGVFLTSGTAISFDSNLSVSASGTTAFVTAIGGGFSGELPIFDNSVFKITGTAISFDTNLIVVSTGTVAFVSSTGGSGTDIGARVYRSTGTALDSGVDTPLPFDSERWDTDNIHSGTSTQLYCNTAGKYLISGNIEIAANATGHRQLYIRLNGSTDICRDGRMTVSSAGVPTRINISTIYSLSVGDYVELVAYGSAAITVVSAGNRSPEFMMQKIA